MRKLVETDEWKILQNSWEPAHTLEAESLFSIGNGRMGQRANFEETYSGDTLQGTYIAGIYYPDKTRVGWWKIGYPEYFAKVLNAPSWINVSVQLDGDEIDLATCEVLDFSRELNMQKGYLLRTAHVRTAAGHEIRIHAQRFCSMANSATGWLRYTVESVNYNGPVRIAAGLDADVHNEDANYEEQFWENFSSGADGDRSWVTSRTRKTEFGVCTTQQTSLTIGEEAAEPKAASSAKASELAYDFTLEAGSSAVLTKCVTVVSTLDFAADKLAATGAEKLTASWGRGFDADLEAQAAHWAKVWKTGDVKIEGDAEAQQAIRFCIFQLYQTYTGEDPRMNIGPKGFTGEKYGGSTYWDTEAFCLPFYLCTAPPEVSRQLLVYRHKHLPKAIENAEKLGFKNGAALYPMVTMNGEECHNEWEITFEEIHRNGAIAYAIFNYIRHTNDTDYLAEYGFEVLLGISRFWQQRSSVSERKQKYMILGVTGPNEYENNVNNNWYTNTMATWTMEYTIEVIDFLKESHPERYQELVKQTNFEEVREVDEWIDIIENMYYPKLKGTRVLLQQQGYMDKEQQLVSSLDPGDRPLNQNWSWDRILRSPFIKQADVLQGIYCFEERFDTKTIEENFDFYEPRTVHESSLSPCVHAVLAARIGREKKAHEMYLRTSRLDLDDYNHEVAEGLHITSMAGSWVAIVEGFGGKRVRDGQLHLSPFIPAQWDRYAFQMVFRGHPMSVTVTPDQVTIEKDSNGTLELVVFGQKQTLEERTPLVIEQQVPAEA